MKRTLQRVVRMKQKVKDRVASLMRPKPATHHHRREAPRLLAIPTLRELREEFANWKTFDRFSLEEFS